MKLGPLTTLSLDLSQLSLFWRRDKVPLSVMQSCRAVAERYLLSWCQKEQSWALGLARNLRVNHGRAIPMKEAKQPDPVIKLSLLLQLFIWMYWKPIPALTPDTG